MGKETNSESSESGDESGEDGNGPVDPSPRMRTGILTDEAANDGTLQDKSRRSGVSASMIF